MNKRIGMPAVNLDAANARLMSLPCVIAGPGSEAHVKGQVRAMYLRAMAKRDTARAADELIAALQSFSLPQ